VAGVARIGQAAARHTALADDIAVATSQQADGIRQVTVATEQMNGVTQQVAGNAEDASHAAQELAREAGTLKRLVGEFRIGTGR
jgi:methyl-accepting chemotaxis protein